ncbi:uncharacterized protein Dmul_04090 [Desulfococcus multivorans]|nr:uncharacterized protein Dmul_04090 [Desulfococcus multivorans]
MQRRCSTPFGIGDRCGLRTSRQESSFTGAQRLSASEIGADGYTQTPLPDSMCSTPFGIGDRCGHDERHERDIQRVLNAFRHRRSVRMKSITWTALTKMCSTPFGIGDRCGTYTPDFILKNGMCSTPFGIGDRCGPLL